MAIGADCARSQLGFVGHDSRGKTAYCAPAPGGGDPIWAHEKTNVPSPTATRGATDAPEAADIELQVKVCEDETHRSWIECLRDIRGSMNYHGN